MRKISSLMLASILGVATFAGVLANKKVKAQPVKADGEVFIIGDQDMFANHTYNDGIGGSATLDTSGDEYVLTLDNFTYSGPGSTDSDETWALYTSDLAKDLIVKLNGTNHITNTTGGKTFCYSVFFDNNEGSYDVTVTSLGSEKGTLVVNQSGTSSDWSRTLGTGMGEYITIENCIIEATGGTGKRSAGIAFYDGCQINDGAEITAIGGNATGSSTFHDSYGYFCPNGTLSVSGGTINATGGTSASGNSIGLYGSPYLTGGEIVCEGGNSTLGNSIGASIVQSFTPLRNYVFTASGGSAPNGSSYGVNGRYSSSKLTLYESNSATPASFVAYGDTLGLNIKTENYYPGYGWDNTSGSGDPSIIEKANSEMNYTYKRVFFRRMIYSVSPGDTVNYDGASHQGFTVTVTTPASGYTISYKLDEESSYTEGIPYLTNAGNYVIYYKIECDDYSYTPAMGSVNFIIRKLNSEITTAPVLASNVTYDGLSHDALSNAGSATGGTIKFRVGDTGDYWETAPLTFSNAGNYKIYYKVFGDTNHKDSNPVELGTFTIQMAEITNISVSQVGTLTYNGSAQTATVSASATTVNSQAYTFTYSATEGGTYTSSVPSFTDAGSHTVYYKVSADNHVTATGQFEVNIDKVNPTFVAPVGKSGLFIYNGLEQELLQSAGSATGGTIYYKVNDGAYSTDLPTATNAGDYTVYYKVVGDSNHNDIAESSLSVHLREANLVAYSVTQEETLTYNGFPQVATVSESVKVTGHQPTTFHYSTSESGPWSDTVPAFTDAGDHTVYCYISAPNHFDTEVFSFTVTINKASSTLVPPTGQTGLVYNGGEQNLLNSIGSATGGTIQYKVNDGSYSTTPPQATYPGTYTVYYKVVGDSNHNNIDEDSFDVTISPASITGVSVTQNGSLTYNGSAQTASVSTSATTVNDEVASFLYSKTVDGSYTPSVPSFTDAGNHTVYYKY